MSSIYRDVVKYNDYEIEPDRNLIRKFLDFWKIEDLYTIRPTNKNELSSWISLS